MKTMKTTAKDNASRLCVGWALLTILMVVLIFTMMGRAVAGQNSQNSQNNQNNININQLINEQTQKRIKVMRDFQQDEQGATAYKELEQQAWLKTAQYNHYIAGLKRDQIDAAMAAKQLNSSGMPLLGDIPITANKNENGKNKTAPRAMVFISLSMPDPLIKQLLTQAHQFQIPVVIRGLLNNSFKETITKIFDLTKAPLSDENKNIGGVEINPVWFRKFHIEQVPAVVVTSAKEAEDFDVVYGNIPIKRALKIISQQGEAGADTARNILKGEDHV